MDAENRQPMIIRKRCFTIPLDEVWLRESVLTSDLLADGRLTGYCWSLE